MKQYNNKYSSSRLSDHIVFCHICGQPCWYSESIRLDQYTGRGGLLVCKRDADKIDYSLVPFKVPPERPAEEVAVNNFADETADSLFSPITDYQTINPLDGTRADDVVAAWDQLLTYTWDQWVTPWDRT